MAAAALQPPPLNRVKENCPSTRSWEFRDSQTF